MYALEFVAGSDVLGLACLCIILCPIMIMTLIHAYSCYGGCFWCLTLVDIHAAPGSTPHNGLHMLATNWQIQ